MLSLAEALRCIHAPRCREELDQARRRLVFDEFLLLQLGLLQRRSELRSRPAPELLTRPAEGGLLQRFRSCSRSSSQGQQRVFAEIEADLAA